MSRCKKTKEKADDCIAISACVKERERHIYGYPGYPAEPRPPHAPSLRMTGRQQSQLETHAVHHTHTETNAVSSPADSLDR